MKNHLVEIRMTLTLNMIYKIILVGESGVGKSSYLQRLTEDTYIPNCYMTMGVDFKSIETEVHGRKVKVHMWDTTGQEKFRIIVKSYYRGAVGAMVFFDISSENSLNATEMWIADLLTARDPQPCRILLVGHKADASDKIDSVHVADFIADLQERYKVNICYCEVSSKNGTGVTEALSMLLDDIYREWPVYDNGSTVYPVGIRIERRPQRLCTIL